MQGREQTVVLLYQIIYILYISCVRYIYIYITTLYRYIRELCYLELEFPPLPGRSHDFAEADGPAVA